MHKFNKFNLQLFATELVTKFSDAVDELFAQESQRAEVTNDDYDFTGAHTVKVYKVTTATMNDYDRSGAGDVEGESFDGFHRYGVPEKLEATTESLTLTKDRSFTFVTDRLDEEESGDALEAGKALARQEREVIIPEIDSYTYGVMANNAGFKPDAIELTSENIYDEITKGTEALDDALAPASDRKLIVKPAVYRLLKKCGDVLDSSDISNEARKRGVVAMLDGMSVIKCPASRLPQNFGFMIAHPSATVAPVKLQSYKTHDNPPGVSGYLVEGRIVYDAFVLDNKAKAIYYQAATPAAGA